MTVMTGRLVGAAALDNSLLSEPTPAAFEPVNRMLSFSNTFTSISRLSAMLSLGRPHVPLGPAGRMPDQLGIPRPRLVVTCTGTVITVPLFLGGVLAFPPSLERETAVWLPVVDSLVVVVVAKGA